MNPLRTTMPEHPAAAAPMPAPARSPARSRPQRLLHGYLHKTSNSLCGIKGYASLIASGEGVDPRATTWARKIIAEVENLEAIYRSVQDVAFPAEGCAAGGDLAAAIDHAVGDALARHGNLDVRIGRLTPCGPALPAHDLGVAVAEILANSAESRADGAPVSVVVDMRRTAGGRARLRISDDGPGMPRSLAAEAVDPFVSTKDGHVGIGLTRVETIMDIYGLGWTLWSRPGVGTTVELEIGGPDRGPAPSPRGRNS